MSYVNNSGMSYIEYLTEKKQRNMSLNKDKVFFDIPKRIFNLIAGEKTLNLYHLSESVLPVEKPSVDEEKVSVDENNIDDLLLLNLGAKPVTDKNIISYEYELEENSLLNALNKGFFSWDYVNHLFNQIFNSDRFKLSESSTNQIPKILNYPLDALRQQLYKMSLEEINNAISSIDDMTDPKTIWTLHFCKGIIQLGFVKLDSSVINPEQASKSLQKALAFLPESETMDQVITLMCLSYSAYIQKKTEKAIDIIHQALELNDSIGELYYLSAKYYFNLNNLSNGFNQLSKAIDFESFFLLKAVSDSDFNNHLDELFRYILQTKEIILLSYNKNLSVFNNFYNSLGAEILPDQLKELHVVFNQIDETVPYLEIKICADELQRNLMKKFIFDEIVPDTEKNMDIIFKSVEEYQEKVVDQPRKWFKPEVSHIETKTRTTITKSPSDIVIKNFKKVIRQCSGYTLAEFEYVLIQGGTFDMGEENSYKDEQPVHQVTLNDFYIGRYPVTQDLWTAVMGYNHAQFKCEKNPIEMVNWYDAIVFCNKFSLIDGLNPCYSKSGKTDPSKWGKIPDLKNKDWDEITFNSTANGYRLLTESEWEFAARGGLISQQNIYSGDNDVNLSGWYNRNSENKSHPVASKIENELGLYDLSGNVWEWCWDWYSDYLSGSQINPLGAEKGSYRVLRGGSWRSDKERLKVVFRDYHNPSLRYGFIGFRIGKTV